MRPPTDLPRPRNRIGSRGRIALVALVVALFVLLTSLRGIAGFYTDFLWFDSLGYRSVFTGVLGAKITLVVIFSLVFFVLLWVNLFIADRLAPRFRPAGPEEEVIERYHEIIGNRTGLVRLGIAAVFGLIAGAGQSGRWHDWILFRHAQDFGVDDPQFGRDVGFYVFQMPFLTFVIDWLFASMVIILIVTAVAHYVNGGIRVQGAAQRVTPQVKAHLSVLLALLAVVRAGGYWFERFELTLSSRGTVDGALYTDVKAQLPALNLLLIISAVAVALFIVNIWRRGWVLPVLAVGLWAFVALVVGGIYPLFVQRIQVEPTESSKERPYIEHNIVATRAALGLEIESRAFAADDSLSARDLANNSITVRNIRLWDPFVLRRTYQRLQEVRPYYRINDVDVDRYDVNGETTQMLVSARDLHTSGVPQGSWEARHLTYTHGHGLVMSPANSKTPSGGPDLLLRDVPVTDRIDLGVDELGLYFGERLGGYVIVDTDRPEIDYQDEDETITGSYEGADGVGIGSITRRLAFALRFGDINPLISGNIRSDSRILYIRDVKSRVEAIAPFLSFDADPYPVAVGGELKWIIDGYTTTSRYPYAQQAERGALPAGSGLDHGFNYIRNSVKAVVDAYDGTATFYVIDDEDPVLRAYRSAFPEVFTDGSEISEELAAHFRYPEDLFRVQTNMWGRYHITDPDDFYNLNDAWNVAQDPGTAGVISTTQPVDDDGEPTGPAREARIDPYYLLMRLPGEDREEFLMLRPFVPVSADDSRKELTAFMVAGSDPGRYGQLRTYVMPRGNLPAGPGIAGASIGANETVAELQTLLGQQGSAVILGNLVLIPIEQSLMYVQPMYVESTQTRIPELRKVIVYYNDRVTVSDTLQQALEAIFGESPETGESIAGETPDDGDGEEPGVEDVLDLLNQAIRAFEEADAALAAGDLGTYQRKNEEGHRLVERAQEQVAPTTTTTVPEGDAPADEDDATEAS